MATKYKWERLETTQAHMGVIAVERMRAGDGWLVAVSYGENVQKVIYVPDVEQKWKPDGD